MAKKLKEWFDEELAVLLAEKISSETVFNGKNFAQDIKSGVENLELKDRVELIADKLDEYLGGTYKTKVKTLIKILGPENELETGMFTEGYWVMPIAKYVEKYGLDDYEHSIDAIAEITKRNTGEYAIRPYIRKYQNETLKIMSDAWAQSENFHLRRLASEGVRINLPWATKLKRFIEDPSPIIRIIEQLKDDDSRYVQKSVANNLNDILKVNRSFAVDVIERWSFEPTKNRSWVLKHALRNLRKVNDPWARSIVERVKS